MLVLAILRRFSPFLLRLAGLVVVVAAGWYVGDRVLRWLLPPPLPGPAAVAARLRLVQELATARVVVRTIQRGAASETGFIISNTDEVLCSLLVTGDYGFDLATIGPERVKVRPGRVEVTLPKPALLAPGFTVSPAEVLAQRSTRWTSDVGPGQLAAVQATRGHALAEAPARLAELQVDREVRDATRTALRRLLPRLLGDPALKVVVGFDDEPAPSETPDETVPPPAPGANG